MLFSVHKCYVVIGRHDVIRELGNRCHAGLLYFGFVLFQALNRSVHRFHPGFQAHNDHSREQREQQKEPPRVKPDSGRNFNASLPNGFICF